MASLISITLEQTQHMYINPFGQTNVVGILRWDQRVSSILEIGT